MIYVLYSLLYVNGAGGQPYQQVVPSGATFSGGLANNGGRYLGLLYGTDEQCATAVSLCYAYGMQEISQAEAEALVTFYTIAPSQQIIIANGIHTATVTVSVRYVDPIPTTDTITVNDVEQPIDLVNGAAELEFTSNVAGTIIYLEYHGLYAVINAV